MVFRQILTGPSVRSDSPPRAADIRQQYLRAFTTDASVLVVASTRVDAIAGVTGFAGWYVTDCSERFRAVAAGGPDADTDELVIETSGTTGAPKLVCYRKQAIRDCAVAIGEALELGSARRYISLANPRLALGLSIIHSHHLASVPVRIEAPPTSLAAWARFRESLVPYSAVYLLPHQSFLIAQDPQWRFDAPIDLIFGGAALQSSMVARLRRSFPNATVTNMYGQAELGPRIAIGRSAIADFHEGDVGHPLPGVRVRATGPAGDLAVDTPYRMECYLTATGQSVAEETPTTWWSTGDVGRVEADGRVLVTGRSAPDINFLGARVSLAHLRRIVRRVDGVLDVRVFAADHSVFGRCPHIRILVPSRHGRDTVERAVRIALSDNIGKAAAAVVVDIVDPASLPESGKL